MEQAEGLRAWFPRPRGANAVGLLSAVVALGVFQYFDRAVLSYLQYWCNFAVVTWVALPALIFLVLRRLIVKHQALYVLLLIGGVWLGRQLPVPARPDVRAFVRHQEGYAQLLSLATSGQLTEDTSLLDEAGLASAPPAGAVLAVPPEYGALHLGNVVIEQEEPPIVGFASRRYLATVYYLGTPLAAETLRGRIEPAGYALEPLRDAWWLVWQPD
jgi:hypothetical protein